MAELDQIRDATVWTASDIPGAVGEPGSQDVVFLGVGDPRMLVDVMALILGVVNTLALSVLERTQEIGMMRAVGLGRGQLRATMVIEGVLIASLAPSWGSAPVWGSRR